MKTHQGSSIQSWIEEQYDSVNRFAVFLAESEGDTSTKVHSKFVNLLWGVVRQEHIKKHYHDRWKNEVAPHINGRLLSSLLKEVAKPIRNEDSVSLEEYRKKLYIMEGKYEAAKENQNDKILEALADIKKELRELKRD